MASVDRLALLYVLAVEVEEAAMKRVDAALASGDRMKLQLESDEFNRCSVLRARSAQLYILANGRRMPKAAERVMQAAAGRRA